MLEAKTKLTSVVCPFLLRQKLKSAQRSCIRTLQPLFEDHNCIPFLRWKPEPSQALETCLQHHNFPSIWWLFHLLSWSFLPPKTVSYFIPYKLQISPPVAGLWSKHSVKIVSKVTPMTSPGSLLIHCPALLNKIYSTYFKALEKRVSGSLVSRLCWTSNTSRGMCSTSVGRLCTWLCPTISFLRLKLLRILREQSTKKQQQQQKKKQD